MPTNPTERQRLKILFSFYMNIYPCPQAQGRVKASSLTYLQVRICLVLYDPSTPRGRGRGMVGLHHTFPRPYLQVGYVRFYLIYLSLRVEVWFVYIIPFPDPTLRWDRIYCICFVLLDLSTPRDRCIIQVHPTLPRPYLQLGYTEYVWFYLFYLP